MNVALSQLKLFQDCHYRDKISRVCSLYKYLSLFPVQVFFLIHCWQDFSAVEMTAITVKRIILTTVHLLLSSALPSATIPSQALMFFCLSKSTIPRWQAQAHISFRMELLKSSSVLDIVPRSHSSCLLFHINISSIPLPLNSWKKSNFTFSNLLLAGGYHLLW